MGYRKVLGGVLNISLGNGPSISTLRGIMSERVVLYLRRTRRAQQSRKLEGGCRVQDEPDLRHSACDLTHSNFGHLCEMMTSYFSAERDHL